jgi:hypothetical protein
VKLWHDGVRVRHWADHNSIKVYNEQNVLRFEMTMNDPSGFRVHRHAEGNPEGEKKLPPMRKGMADIAVRAMVSKDRVKIFTEHMAAIQEKTPVGKLIAGVSAPVIRKTLPGT